MTAQTAEDSGIRACAEKLAHAHIEIDPETERIFLARASGEVRLIEITPSVDLAYEVLPVGFPADRDQGIDYRSAVILLHPKEWEAIERGEMQLPEGWEDRDVIYQRACAS